MLVYLHAVVILCVVSDILNGWHCIDRYYRDIFWLKENQIDLNFHIVENQLGVACWRLFQFACWNFVSTKVLPAQTGSIKHALHVAAWLPAVWNVPARAMDHWAALIYQY